MIRGGFNPGAVQGERPGVEVALFIDWENIKLSLREHYGTSPNIDSILDAASAYGRVVLARAYADWTNNLSRVDAPNLYRAGIEPIYVPGREENGRPLKNSADVRLAVDAVDVCGRLPHVKTYVLVTGDGDLIHAVNFLQTGGHQVVVVGVRRTISALLATASDVLMLYERDVEPLDLLVTPLVPQGEPGEPGHSLDGAFEWVKAAVAEPRDDRPVPFKRLRNELRLRHGLDTRAWFDLPFRHFMLQAERAGHVHLSTVGGLDYASLVRAEPRLDAPAAEDAAGAPRRSGESLDIRLDSLADDEQRSLLAFLNRLQGRSPYMVRKYIVDNLEYESILPRLARDQIERLVQSMVEQEVLAKRFERVVHPTTGDSFYVDKLSLNEKHPFVGEHLSPVDPFGQLLETLEAVRESRGVAYFPLVQEALERRLERRLSELGYRRLTAFFEEAEQRGMVRIAHLADGSDILLFPDEALPEAEALTRSASVTEEIGPEGVDAVLRIVAAAEDQVGGEAVTPGSLVYAVRQVLPDVAGLELGSSQINRLLKDELTRAGCLRSFPLSLLRDAPRVRAVLAQERVVLPEGIDVARFVQTADPAGRPYQPPAPLARDPSWPTPEDLAADLAARRRDVLFESILSLLRRRAPHEYRDTDLGNDLRQHFSFRLDAHAHLPPKFRALMDEVGRLHPVEARRQDPHYFYTVRVSPAPVAAVAAVSAVAAPDALAAPAASVEAVPAPDGDTASPPPPVAAVDVVLDTPATRRPPAPITPGESERMLEIMDERSWPDGTPVREIVTAIAKELAVAPGRRMALFPLVQAVIAAGRVRFDPSPAEPPPVADEAPTAAGAEGDAVTGPGDAPLDPAANAADGDDAHAPVAPKDAEAAPDAAAPAVAGPDPAVESASDPAVEPDPAGAAPAAVEIPDPVLAVALRDMLAFEDERGDRPISPVDWRKRFRQAIAQAGGPVVPPKEISRFLRSQMVPRGILEPTAQDPDPAKRLRPYRVYRGHENVASLLALLDPAPTDDGEGGD